MSDVQIKTQVVMFPCEPWQWKPNEGSIQPIKGTWTLAPLEVRVKQNILALVSCPNCGLATLLTEELVTLNPLTHNGEMPLLRCAGCPFACQPVFLEWDKRKLFCAAYEKIIEGKIKAFKEYMHAEDVNEARKNFLAGHCNDIIPVSNIVGIARVIGYIVQDDKGEKLSV